MQDQQRRRLRQPGALRRPFESSRRPPNHPPPGHRAEIPPPRLRRLDFGGPAPRAAVEQVAPIAVAGCADAVIAMPVKSAWPAPRSGSARRDRGTAGPRSRSTMPGARAAAAGVAMASLQCPAGLVEQQRLDAGVPASMPRSRRSLASPRRCSRPDGSASAPSWISAISAAHDGARIGVLVDVAPIDHADGTLPISAARIHRTPRADLPCRRRAPAPGSAPPPPHGGNLRHCRSGRP